MNVKLLRWMTILMMAVLMLVACAPAPAATDEPEETEEPTEEVEPTEEEEVEETEVPEATEEATEAATEEALGEPLKIGVMQDLTGPLQLFGNEAWNGFQIGMDYATDGSMSAGGRPIELVFMDDTSNPETAAAAARELIEAEGVEILIGNSSSGAALQVQQIAAENDVVYIAGPAAAPDITGAAWNEHTFRVCRNAAQDPLVIVPWAMENIGENYMILAEDYAFGQQTAASFMAVINAMGGTVSPDSTPMFAASDTVDFTPFIQQIVDGQPDGLVLVWANNTSGTILFEQLAAQGITGTIPFVTGFTSNDATALLDPGFIGSTGLVVYHYTLPDTEANDYLVEQYQERFDENPDLFSECGFATAQAVVAAIDAAEGDTSSEALIAALEGLSFEGPKGTYTIRAEDHQALAPGYVVELVSVDDPDEAYFELVEERAAEDIAPPCVAPDRCE